MIDYAKVKLKIENVKFKIETSTDILDDPFYREVQPRVSPAGSEFGHRNGHERALVHVRVREFEARSCDGKSIDGYDVDVECAVAVGAVGVAVRRGTRFAFALLHSIE